MPYDQKIAARLNLQPAQVKAAIDLLDAGNTVPFIARYRKEMTGGLDEDFLRRVSEAVTQLRSVDERRNTIIASIEEQGKMTPELRQQLAAADTLTTLEDLYLPYKPKRRTRASIARDKGLQPLADLIVQQARVSKTLDQLAQPFLNAEVLSTDDAFAGARDIVAEAISDHADVRRMVRDKAQRIGILRGHKIDDTKDEKAVFQLYYDFEQRLDRLKPYQVLAINRGESEKVLRVSLEVADRDWRMGVESVFRSDPRSLLADQMTLAIDDAAKRLLLPAIERDVRRVLTEQAEAHAISVFAANLRALLSQPPINGQTVLGLDPAFRSGCKLAIIDPTGKVLTTGVIYPHEPQRQRDAALKTLAALVERYHVSLIAIGNGTASRETEQLAADLTREREGLHYVIVNEAGASVYSASPLARAEMPDLDVTIRGAVSIARRVQDPLAELVKIDPQSIGVGMYQHDVNQKQLSESLAGVVETVVNRVGVDLNTASSALLTYVAGIGAKLSDRIIAYRDENGPFGDRKTLKKVAGLGPKAFEQCAGFLRVRGGANPLDATAIHPESYPIAEAVLKRAGLRANTPVSQRDEALTKLQPVLNDLAAELQTGLPTLTDIFEQLARPGRDPRDDMPKPLLRSDVLSVEDLQRGMRLTGTVRNVVDFGAFIDIGVKNDGLLHRSQIPRGTTLNVGDIIEVEITTIEAERGRIGLGWVGA